MMTKAQEILADKIDLHLRVNSPGFHLSDDDMRLIVASLHSAELPKSPPQGCCMGMAPADQCECEEARLKQTQSPITQHIAWLKQYIDGMNKSNWKDMRLRAERQLEQISSDLDARSLTPPVFTSGQPRSSIDPADIIERLESGPSSTRDLGAWRALAAEAVAEIKHLRAALPQRSQEAREKEITRLATIAECAAIAESSAVTSNVTKIGIGIATKIRALADTRPVGNSK